LPFDCSDSKTGSTHGSVELGASSRYSFRRGCSVGGTLPFWHLLRGKAWAQGSLRGANAAVGGLLFAALYNPVWREGVTNARDSPRCSPRSSFWKYGGCRRGSSFSSAPQLANGFRGVPSALGR
jgi:hypothetical protein